MKLIKNEFKSIIDFHLQRIANALLLNASFINNLGLLNGKMGIAIFFYHYSGYTGKENYKNFAKELINEVFQEINIETPIDFANGLTGIGWSIEYLNKKGLVSEEKYPTLAEIDKTIYFNSLKTPLILVNKEDLCSYGLYYLSRLNEHKNENSLNILVKKQLLIYLHDDCEKMMTQDELFGFEVPILTTNQLNSLVFFLCKIQELQLFPIKITKLESFLPHYIKLKVEKSDSIIENFTLKKLLENLCSNITNKELINDYKNIIGSLEEKLKFNFQYNESLIKELNILAWYSLLYPIEYNHYSNFKALIENAFNEINNEKNWDRVIDKLYYGNIGLDNGIAGQGLSLLNYSLLKNNGSRKSNIGLL
jgi:hypothetical protein